MLAAVAARSRGALVATLRVAGQRAAAIHSSSMALQELPPGPAVGTPIPVSISKDGEDPVIQEDSAYPEWLFQIGATEQETTEEMLSRGLKNLSYTEGRQLFRMLRRDKIKASNKANRKIG